MRVCFAEMRRLALTFLALAACGDQDSVATDGGPPAPWPVTATLNPAPADGLLPAGPAQDGLSAILPGGRKITPVGTQIAVGGFPIGMRILPGGAHMIVTDAGIYDEFLSLVDTSTLTVVQQIPYPEHLQKALFLGLAVRADGHIFVSGGGSNVI